MMDSIIGEEMEKGRWSVVIGDAAWQLLSNGGERRIGWMTRMMALWISGSKTGLVSSSIIHNLKVIKDYKFLIENWLTFH